LKRVTNFITGAFDPVWTDGGDILFTAFDNFSMQIMHLKNALDKFEQSPLAAVDSIVEKRSFWQVEKLKGQTAASAVKYKRKFNLDVAQSQITQDPIFGTSGGAQLAMTDMLGNEQYYFLIFNNAQTKEEFFESFNVAVSRVDLSRRTNFAVGLYHFAGRYYNYAEGFFYERRYGGFGAISYPFSVFKRLEGSLNIRKSDKDWYGAYKRINALLVSNYISFIKDNSLWGPTGPMDGERYNFTLGNTLDIQHSDVNFYTIIADYRKYFRLSRRMCYAMRLTGQFNHGKEALRFFMGGSWDLRGYRRWTIWGKKIALVSNELRFPFIDHFIINFPFGGLGFSSIRGATFVDVGNAWDEKLEDLLGSFGFGIRFRVGGVLVLRFDYGKKFAMHRLRGWDALTDIEFQRGTFKQFFFGWDF
ncbi:MAG: BamA/TamA family outer membrane protein, partial [candidate division KSB1 bacterium]|nr:BamA/TamA family outer membrane protein [candidate division KSB1 bacterium]